MEQANRFQKLVAHAKQHVTEISPADARKQVEEGEAVLIGLRAWKEAGLPALKES